MLNPAVLQNQDFRLVGAIKDPVSYFSFKLLCVCAREMVQGTEYLLCM